MGSVKPPKHATKTEFETPQEWGSARHLRPIDVRRECNSGMPHINYHGQILIVPADADAWFKERHGRNYASADQTKAAEDCHKNCQAILKS
jgi:hypothetical protein